MNKLLALLLKPLYELLISKGIEYIKELIKQIKERRDVKKCLDKKDPIKRSNCIKNELDDE